MFSIISKEILTPLNKAKLIPFVVVGFLYLIGIASPLASAQQTKRPFTVADDISMTTIGDNSNGDTTDIEFSPDGKYFAVCTNRGRLDLNRVEGSLRFYRSQEVENFLHNPKELRAPSPIWVVDRFQKERAPFRDWQWLADSGGVAFLEAQTYLDVSVLMLADVRKKKIEQLSLVTEDVRKFDVRDKNNLIYTVADPAPLQKMEAERQSAAFVGKGRSINAWLLFEPNHAVPRSNYVLAVVGGKRFGVKRNGAPLVSEGDYVDFTLSPDGHWLATTLPVDEVPPAWKTLYLPAYSPSSPDFRFRLANGRAAHQYVRIDLQTDFVEALTDAPIGPDNAWWAGWGMGGTPRWSSDGQAIVLLNTFLKSKDSVPSRPCVAVVDLQSNTRSCVEILKGHLGADGSAEEGYHYVSDARFVEGDKHRVKVTFSNPDQAIQSTEYQQSSDGTWRAVEQVEQNGLKVTVKQSFNEPPRLVATDKQISRVIWDPNPQFQNIELGKPSVYTWRDKEGKERKGGLYKPSDYKPGQRYPLVIQTHGFNQSIFMPSGAFTTAMAARELAAKGIMVLQVGEVGNCQYDTVDEGPCNAAGYEAVANQLVSERLVDPERAGIIGFSRTCFHVMEMLTKGFFHLKAASITAGVMFTYPQFILWPPDAFGEAKQIIGAEPFGEGLQKWLKESPGFNLDKINTPLLVVGEGPGSVLDMWEPYAGLRYLHKPVDLIMLNTDEHVLTNPAVRMASQGGSVDWFRFWLQDYEDPDPTKAEQYKRWRELRKLQEENEKKAKE